MGVTSALLCYYGRGCKGSLLLDIFRSILGYFRGSIVAFVTWVVSRFLAFVIFIVIVNVTIKFIILKFERSLTRRKKTYDNS